MPGHQIAEMALAKLYLVTGQQKYLDQAKFFLDQRGHTSRTDEYSQAHKPVTEQDEAVGHAVRAAYMYAGMADVAALTGDSAYIHAIDRIWDNIVGKKYYITGASGRPATERLSAKTMSCPICRLIARLARLSAMCMSIIVFFLLHGESKYYDVLERTLYNGLISGVSLDGGGFFYPQSVGKYRPASAPALVRLCLLPVQCLSFYPLFAGICLCGEGQGRVCESVYVQYFELEGRG